MAEAQQLLPVVPDRIAKALQDAGYRAEHYTDQAGTENIMSGTNGVPFRVRMGNKAPAPGVGYYDFTLIMIIKVDEAFPLERVNEWNQNRRFSRLHRNTEFLVLDMDVIVAVGVTDTYLRGVVELWDRIIQEMMGFMRGDAQDGGAANAA